MRSKVRETKQGFSLALVSAFVLSLCVPALGETPSAGEAGGVDLRAIQQEINTIKKHQAAERQAEQQRVDQDERTIQTLEQRLQQLESRNAALAHQAQVIELTSAQLKQNSQNLHDLQQELTQRPTEEQFGSLMNRYLGSHQFTWNGAVAGSVIYDRANNTNTFALTFEPLVIYRLNDWISFVGEFEAALPEGSDAEFGFPIGMFQFFLNDYVQVSFQRASSAFSCVAAFNGERWGRIWIIPPGLVTDRAFRLSLNR
jgi:hypothetical protein